VFIVILELTKRPLTLSGGPLIKAKRVPSFHRAAEFEERKRLSALTSLWAPHSFSLYFHSYNLLVPCSFLDM